MHPHLVPASRPAPTPPVLLSIVEAARAAGGMHPQTLRRHVKSGALRAVFIGRRLYIRPADLEAWVDAHVMQ